MPAKYYVILANIIPATLLVIAIVNDYRERARRDRHRMREGF